MAHDHKHDHKHTHDHKEHDCSCEACQTQSETERVWLRGRIHDDAAVISGECRLSAEYGKISMLLKKSLEELAAVIAERNGVIGHIKTAVEIKSVDMFSVTDLTVDVKDSGEQEIFVQLAAIVFFIGLEEMKGLVQTYIFDRLLSLQNYRD